MPLTPEQQKICDDIWGMNVAGDSLSAVTWAMSELNKLDHEDFSNTAIREYLCKILRNIVVIHGSIGKKSRLITTSAIHLRKSLRFIRDHYPMAENQEEAKKRAKYWEKIYDNESTLFICLRDLLRVLEFLSQYIHSDEVIGYIRKIHLALRDMSIHGEPVAAERFHLIYRTEAGEFSDAWEAFLQYQLLHGPTMGDAYTKDQYDTVFSRMLERCLSEEHTDEGAKMLALLTKEDANAQLSKALRSQRMKRLQHVAFSIQSVFLPGVWRLMGTKRVLDEVIHHPYIGDINLNDYS